MNVIFDFLEEKKILLSKLEREAGSALSCSPALELSVCLHKQILLPVCQAGSLACFHTLEKLVFSVLQKWSSCTASSRQAADDFLFFFLFMHFFYLHAYAHIVSGAHTYTHLQSAMQHSFSRK